MKKQKNQVIQTIASYGLGSSSSSNESTIKTVSQMGGGGGWLLIPHEKLKKEVLECGLGQ